MIDYNNKKTNTDWVGFKYKLNNDELIIYAYPWLMTLRKEANSYNGK